MCGITFAINTDTYTPKLDSFLEDALITSQVRGMHSSGLFQVSNLKTIFTHKKALHASDFISEGQARTILNQATRSPLTVGHVRHATVGAHTDENAHPFLVERTDGSKLVGVHNGTLKNWKTKDGADDHEVDSSWAFRKLADQGNEAFKSFNGAFAFVWYDSRTPDVLYCARNKERTLFFMLDEHKKVLLGASELGLLGWVAERNDFKIAKDKDQSGFMYFSPGKVYTINLKHLDQMTMEDFPAYDPSTSPEVSTASWVSERSSALGNNNLRGYRPQPSHSMYDDADWGDRLGDGAYNYYSRNDYSRVHYRSSNQDSILEGVKKALKFARSPAIDGPGDRESPTDEITKEINSLVQEQVLDEGMFSSHPNDATATTEEQNMAKFLQLYGRIVEFNGVLYDESGNSCLGEINMEYAGKSRNDAEVRGLSASAAQHGYINTIQPRLVSIVGAYYFGMDLCFVVSSLTDTARKLYDFKVSRKTRVSAN